MGSSRCPVSPDPAGIIDIQLPLVVQPGQASSAGVGCPGGDDEVISGGVGAATAFDEPVLVVRQSFRPNPDVWVVSVENLDLVNPRNAIAQALCMPTS